MVLLISFSCLSKVNSQQPGTFDGLTFWLFWGCSDPWEAEGNLHELQGDVYIQRSQNDSTGRKKQLWVVSVFYELIVIRSLKPVSEAHQFPS